MFDKCDASTRLIHYTNLGTQPWKFPGHPHEDIWFKHFNEARENGEITQSDVKKTLSRAYARQDILKPGRGLLGNTGTKKVLKQIERNLKRLVRGYRKKAA